MSASTIRVAAAPRDRKRALVEVRDLQVHYALHGSFWTRLTGRAAGAVKAVDGVSFDLREGEVLGLVGESGSGKTTLGRTLLGLAGPTAGSVRIRGQEIAGLPERRLRALRRHAQMVFQDPHAALNPAMDLATAIGHPLRIHGMAGSRAELRARVAEALELVGLTPVEQFLDKRPGDLSGGQKQRAVIARAIVLRPELLVADEPVSMLDMSVRAKILQLLVDLRRTLGLTYLYVTHDLATARFLCDRVAIMYLGRIVEIGPVDEVFSQPRHPYTQALIRAIPDPDPTKAPPRDVPRGEVADATRPPRGCAFHPRCPKAFADCGWEARDLRQLLEQRWIDAGEHIYRGERPLIGDLDALDDLGEDALLPSGRGMDAERLLDLLERIRQERPNEPLWSGVRDMAAEPHGVRVRFAPGEDPALRRSGPVDVACLLHPR